MERSERIRWFAREVLPHEADVRRWLARRIRGLPCERCRMAFELRKLEGLTQREIAQRMGIAESTVEKHLIRRLRQLMGELQEAEDKSVALAKKAYELRSKGR